MPLARLQTVGAFLLSVLLLGLPPRASLAAGETEFLAGQSKSCPSCSLPRAPLKRKDLTDADLSGANLAGAVLHRAKLFRA